MRVLFGVIGEWDWSDCLGGDGVCCGFVLGFRGGFCVELVCSS